MKNKTISIIIPVFNVQEYLAECIDSVLRQTYVDYEIILIDDGSTDDSGRICDFYCVTYPKRIKVFHIRNAGPLYARIYGVKSSSGEVLMFLDSDDCLREDALSKIIDCIDAGYDMVLFNADDTANFPSKSVCYPFSDKQVFHGKSREILFHKTISGEIPNSVCLKAIRKECAIIPENIVQFDKVTHGEDLLLSACFFSNCKEIIYIYDGLYHYRTRPGSSVHAFDIQRKKSIKIVHTELEKYVDAWGMTELKPLHNARKVQGWTETLILLIKNKHILTKAAFQDQLQSMAEDPYFIRAYANMDSASLSRLHRVLACCLRKKQYFILHIVATAFQTKQKIKSRSFHGR